MTGCCATILRHPGFLGSWWKKSSVSTAGLAGQYRDLTGHQLQLPAMILPVAVMPPLYDWLLRNHSPPPGVLAELVEEIIRFNRRSGGSVQSPDGSPTAVASDETAGSCDASVV